MQNHSAASVAENTARCKQDRQPPAALEQPVKQVRPHSGSMLFHPLRLSPDRL